MSGIVLNVRPLELTNELFRELCRSNPELQLERSAAGELIVVSPGGSESGRRNARLIQRLLNWADGNGTGFVFDSSSGFTLPNGAIRSPDAAWITRARWTSLSVEERDGFAPLCPDFVVELRSTTDTLPLLQPKMREYLSNGASLGWLIDPLLRRVEVYRPGLTVEVLDAPDALSAEILPGFILDVREIFDGPG